MIRNDDHNIIRNLSEVECVRTIVETFKKYINELSVTDKGNTEILDYIKVGNTKTFTIKDAEKLYPKKSVFNRIVGDSHFELVFSKQSRNSFSVKNCTVSASKYFS